MNVVVFGQKWFGAEILKRLGEMPGVHIVSVCPDKLPDKLVSAAQEKDIPIAKPSDIPPCDNERPSCRQHGLLDG